MLDCVVMVINLSVRCIILIADSEEESDDGSDAEEEDSDGSDGEGDGELLPIEKKARKLREKAKQDKKLAQDELDMNIKQTEVNHIITIIIS